jgi:segregation and condensation protein A
VSEERDDPPAGEAPASAAPEQPPAAEEQPPASVKLPEGLESTLPDDAPRIQIPLFEGPLDLLLYLVRRDRIDVHDLPIAPITRQYMEYIELMKQLNLDVAGEFMVMAATLIHIKSKLLVPVEPNEAEGEEEVDPREELVQRLLEFERYKQAAEVLHQRGQIRAATWTRPDEALPRLPDAPDDGLVEASLFDLIAAFKELLDRRKVLLAHQVEGDGRSVEDRIQELLELIREGDSLDFLTLFETEETKAGMIVTFLALLELIKLRRVKVYQKGLFGPIRVFRPVGPDEAGGPGPLPEPVGPAPEGA